MIEIVFNFIFVVILIVAAIALADVDAKMIVDWGLEDGCGFRYSLAESLWPEELKVF